MTATKSVQISRSDKTDLAGQYHWFVTPIDSHYPCYSPPSSGDTALKACLTWLGNNGYTGDGEPVGEIFTRAES